MASRFGPKELTFGREVPEGGGGVALDLDRLGLGEGHEHVEHAELQQPRFQLVRQREHRDRRRHLALHAQRHLQHELDALRHGARLQHQLFVLVRRRRKVAQRRDRVALDLLVVCRAQQVHQRDQEACFDDWRLVRGVDGDVADAGDRRQDQGQVRGFEEFEERWEASRAHDVKLVAFVRGEIAESERSLALNFR